MGPSAAWFYEGQLRLHRNNNDWSAVSYKPSAGSIVSAYRVCEHLLMMLVMSVGAAPHTQQAHRCCASVTDKLAAVMQKRTRNGHLGFVYRYACVLQAGRGIIIVSSAVSAGGTETWSGHKT